MQNEVEEDHLHLVKAAYGPDEAKVHVHLHTEEEVAVDRLVH